MRQYDQPQPLARRRHGHFSDSLYQRRSDALVLDERVERDDLTLVLGNAVGQQPNTLFLRERDKTG
jgi:hypothetical protein